MAASVTLPRDSVVPRDLLRNLTARPGVALPQDSWGLEIAGYLYLGGLGAGTFFMTVLLDWLGQALSPGSLTLIGNWSWDWTKLLVYWGPAATGIGASLLILHLGRNWRRFYTAGNNPSTSWMARGFAILMSFIISGLLCAALAVFLPAWALQHVVAWRALQAIGAATALGTAGYTGVLLQSMSYIPAWNVRWARMWGLPLLPVLFLISAISTGAAGFVVGSVVHALVGPGPGSAYNAIHMAERIELLVLVSEASVLTLFIYRMRKGKPEGRLSATLLLRGRWAPSFWLGIAGCALLVPFVLDTVSVVATAFGFGAASSIAAISTREVTVGGAAALLAALSVLLGGFVVRLAILKIGIKETPPLYKFVEWRKAHERPGEAGG